MLKQGDKGKEVIKLQASLLKLGYELPKFGADGDFGSETESAVASFKQELVDLALRRSRALFFAEQEAGSDHFDADGFVKMRCEFWYQYQRSEEHPDYEIRYRSYGIMQILDMGHPSDDYTRGSEVGNITNKELRESVAKNISAGAHLLRNLLSGAECIYSEDDERRFSCKECIEAIETVERDWSETRFHKWRSSDVPSFDGIPCGWAEAIRRYNGSGSDAEAYRDEILTRITGAKRTYVV